MYFLVGKPQQESGHRDSLSVKLDYIKLNISRTRKSTISNTDFNKSDPLGTKAANVVRFSSAYDVTTRLLCCVS